MSSCNFSRFGDLTLQKSQSENMFCPFAPRQDNVTAKVMAENVRD